MSAGPPSSLPTTPDAPDSAWAAALGVGVDSLAANTPPATPER